jgi:hypothetical protein
MICGAPGSAVAAVIITPDRLGIGQVMAPTGIGTCMVGAIPGGPWSLSVVGVAVLGREADVLGAEESAIGTPSLVRTHADATATATHVIAMVVVRQSFISP